MKMPTVITVAISLLVAFTVPATAGLQDGLGLYYSFDTNTGSTVYDQSGDGRTGTVRGATWVTDGILGGAYQFNGTNWIEAGDIFGLTGTATQLTVCAWIKAAPGLDGWRMILGKQRATAPYSGWGLFLHPNNWGFSQIIATHPEMVASDGTSFIGDGRWHFVCGTYESLDGYMQCTLYVDGVLEDTGTRAGSHGATDFPTPLCVGARFPNDSLGFRGMIDEVRIYSRLLAPVEIAQLSGHEFNYVQKDFDGDGISDFGVVRQSKYNNTWYVYETVAGALAPFQFGGLGDTPIPADYDGDGFCDVAVLRPSTMTWYINGSSAGPMTPFAFGAPGDIPIPADFDGDGSADIAVVRPSTMTWYVFGSGGRAMSPFVFGVPGDIPAPADYNGDGLCDVAVLHPSTMTWSIHIRRSGPMAPFAFGAAGDIPVPGDYDGDGSADVAVFRPSTATWYIIGSESGPLAPINFGAPGDVPLK
jgi:hypothetical protein